VSFFIEIKFYSQFEKRIINESNVFFIIINSK